MAGFRNTVLKKINKVASFLPSELLVKITNQKLILPFYHTVSDGGNMPHIKHLYSLKSEKTFEEDLDFLLRVYNPIDYDQFLAFKNNNRSPKKPSFLLSFDDGLREFHDIIAPILIRKGIPAVCFLNSNFIDNKGLFFRYKASLLIEKFQKNKDLIEKKEVQNFLNAVPLPTDDISKFILSINYQNKNLLDDLAKTINYDFEDFLSEFEPYLTSQQITYLIDQGFYFGGHSIDHPEYQYLKQDEQLRQTKESVKEICSKFSLNYKTFSFPFTDYGVSKQFFVDLMTKNVVDVTFGCAGLKQEMIPNHFQRIPFELDNLPAKELLNAELLYFILKIPFGKNKINRK